MKNMETALMALGSLPISDAELFVKWMWGQRQNTDFDRAILGYPRTCMAQVKQNDETIALVPVHTVFALESLARDPNLTDSQLVLALNGIDKKIQQAMKDSGVAEAFFTTGSERFVYICERHGWKVKLYDPEKKQWLLKKRADVDWQRLLEGDHENFDKPSS